MLLSELLRTPSEQEIFNTLLGYMATDPVLSRFPVTDWEEGGVAHALLRVDARALADLHRSVYGAVAGGLTDTAQGDWLTLLAGSHYNLDRLPSVFARWRLTMTVAAGLGPYEVKPGQLWAATASGRRYNNLDGGVLTATRPLTLTFQAEEPGAVYNVPTGTITRLLTPLSGVTITNPLNSLLLAGSDTEDDNRLRTRSRLRWAERGGGGTRAAYEYWARTASPSVTKVLVLDNHPRGQGTVDVILWGEGGLGTEAVQAVNAYIQERRPVTADVSVYSATERPVTVNLTVRAPVTYQPAALIQIQEGLAELQRQLNIGAILYRAALIEVAMLPPGVENVVVASPPGDVVPLRHEVITLVPTITWDNTP